MNSILFLVAVYFTFASSLKTGDDHPTLPTMWSAETIEPGAPGNGKGVEA